MPKSIRNQYYVLVCRALSEDLSNTPNMRKSEIAQLFLSFTHRLATWLSSGSVARVKRAKANLSLFLYALMKTQCRLNILPLL